MNEKTNAVPQTGIFYGYIIVIACFFLMMVLWGTYYSFSVFFEPLINEFGWSRSVISAAFSIMSFLFGMFSLPIAKFCEKFGVRKVVLVCGLCMGVGNLLLSQIHSVWQLFLLYDILIAIGMGAYISLLPLVSRWFTKRRSFMTGILFSGMGLAGVVLPPLMSQLLHRFGWRTSYVVLGVIVIVVTGIASQFLKDHPSDMGLVPYGEEPHGEDTVLSGLTLSQATKTFQFWLFTGLYFAYSFYLTIFVAHIVIHSIDIGLAGIAASVMAVFGVFQIVGMNCMGLLADKYGHKLAFIISLMLTVISFVMLLTVAKTAPLMLLFAVVVGFAAGGMLMLFSPTVADTFGLKSQGVILSSISFAGGLGALFGPYVAGYIYDVNKSYVVAFTLCLTLSLLATIAAFLIRPIKENSVQKISLGEA